MKSKYPVTIILVVVNCIVFLALAFQQRSVFMSTSADVLAILDAGANLNPYTIGGEYWRIFSCMFLHFGVVHLAVNMFALWGLGRFIEPGIGSTRFILLYLICGVAASLSSLFFNVYVISAGASGAIFGLYGFQLAAQFIGNLRDKEVLKSVLINFVIFVVINGVIAGSVNVDISAHIGGAVAGLLIAIAQMQFGFLRKKPEMAALFVALPFLVVAVPRGQLNYYRIFNNVIALEEKTHTNLKAIKNDAVLADSLKQTDHQLDSLRDELSRLKSLPNSLAHDTAILAKYVVLQQRDLMYRMKLLDQSYIYLDSLETLYAATDSLPKFNHSPVFKRRASEARVQDESKNDSTQVERKELIKVYYDKDWKETELISNAEFFRIGFRDSLGRWQGAVRDFYLNGDIQMKGNYIDDLQDGVFLYYSDHHTYTSAGRYEKEYPIGKFELFHWNGKREREVFYGNGVYVKNIWDSTGNLLVENGDGKYKRWHANGALAEEGAYLNGRREGYWFGYHDNGEPFYKELFKDNRLINGASRTLNGKQFVYDNLSEYAFPSEGMSEFQAYLRETIERDKLNANCRGSVRVLFNVGADGSLWDFVILQGKEPKCNLSAIDLVKKGPAWRPALEHGCKPVVSQTFVEVKF
jgi:membrane associated rhomboid family serine protease/antitoxin component YwqK of YwqJK toxin-antitoxin module